MGNRTVANALEYIGDSLYIIGRELQEVFQKSEPVKLRATMHEIAEYAKFVNGIGVNATNAFFSENLKLANEAIRREEGAEMEGKALRKDVTSIGEWQSRKQEVNIRSDP